MKQYKQYTLWPCNEEYSKCITLYYAMYWMKSLICIQYIAVIQQSCIIIS